MKRDKSRNCRVAVVDAKGEVILVRRFDDDSLAWDFAELCQGRGVSTKLTFDACGEELVASSKFRLLNAWSSR